MSKTWMVSALVAAVACLASAEPVSACSENVFRPGQGMAYRKLASTLPARVLIDADPAARAFDAVRAGELEQALLEAGHSVVVATDTGQRAAALAAEPFDVVFTGVDQAAALLEAEAGGQAGPIGIPVAARAHHAMLRQRFPHVVDTDASLRQVLKAIERTMESRRR